MKYLVALPLLAVAATAQIGASSESNPAQSTLASSPRPAPAPAATSTGSSSGGGPSPSSANLAKTPQADLLALLAPVIGTLSQSLASASNDAVNAEQDGKAPAVEAALDGIISTLEEGTLMLALVLQGVERSRLGDLLGGQKGVLPQALDGLQNSVADIGKLLRGLVHGPSEQ